MFLQLCLCLLMLIQCNGYQTSWNQEYGRKKIPQEVMVDVVNNLALKLLAIHNEDNNNNIAISPYGAVSVLVALGEGLRGDAIYEIQRASNIPNDISVIRIGLRDIHRHLKSYFIPEEGFLSGLTLSHDNVTLNREYEDILRFYGYDINSFNNGLYPNLYGSTTGPSSTTEIDDSSTEMTTITESVATEEMTTKIEATTTSTSTIPTTVYQSTTTEQTTKMTSTIPTTTTTKIPETTTITTTTTEKEPEATTKILETTTTPTTTEKKGETTTKIPETTTTTTTTEKKDKTTIKIPETTTTTTTTEKKDKTTTKIPETTTTTTTTEKKDETTTKIPETTPESTTPITTTTMKDAERREDMDVSTINDLVELLDDSSENASIITSETEPTTTETTENTLEMSTTETESVGTTTELSKRKKRSIVDYMIARYYDDHFINEGPPPYGSPGEEYFLVNGKRKETGINYMTYDTVLPFHYLSHLKTLALRFPLDSTKYYLLLLLPENPGDIDKLICDLRLNTSLKYIINNLIYTHVKALIPSFMLKGIVILTPTFQKMGIRKVFEPRQADFSPMTMDRGIYVTNIEQAITVTIRNYVDPVTMNSNMYNLQQNNPVEFKANHPFLYFVIDSEIGVTLMAGKIVNPLNSRIR